MGWLVSSFRSLLRDVVGTVRVCRHDSSSCAVSPSPCPRANSPCPCASNNSPSCSYPADTCDRSRLSSAAFCSSIDTRVLVDDDDVDDDNDDDDGGGALGSHNRNSLTFFSTNTVSMPYKACRGSRKGLVHGDRSRGCVSVDREDSTKGMLMLLHHEMNNGNDWSTTHTLASKRHLVNVNTTSSSSSPVSSSFSSPSSGSFLSFCGLW